MISRLVLVIYRPILNFTLQILAKFNLKISVNIYGCVIFLFDIRKTKETKV